MWKFTYKCVVLNSGTQLMVGQIMWSDEYHIRLKLI